MTDEERRQRNQALANLRLALQALAATGVKPRVLPKMYGTRDGPVIVLPENVIFKHDHFMMRLTHG